VGLKSLGPIKLSIFSLLPAAALLLTAEAGIRIGGLDRPAYYSGGFGSIGSKDSGQVADVDLGWRAKPGFRKEGSGGAESYIFNSLGLRSPEVGPKHPGELRILSLGESTTAGVLVAAEDTYSTQLQELLAQTQRPRPVSVINAGVSAYSSFQSLKYLELRGLELEPDMVLFYHEMNDYLPATIRATAQSEVEVLLSDRQLYDSRLVRASRWLLAHSALYRFASYQYSQHLLGQLVRRPGQPRPAVTSPLPEIGLPGAYNIASGVFQRTEGGGQKLVDAIHPATVGRRVTNQERLDNLRSLAAVCKKKGVTLVVMHPSYRRTVRHECLLTRFCEENRVPMFETYDLLHPAGSPPGTMFFDDMHPTPAGHKAIAEGLARFITSLLAG